MLKLILLTFILWNQSLYAQDLSQDLGFIETQNTQSNPFNIPIYVDLAGNINLISRDTGAGTSFNPLGHLAFKTSKSQYIRPVQRSEFSLDLQKEDMGWIEVKRLRWELGLGLGATIANNVMNLGFVPFKGARQVMIRLKKTQDEKTARPKLPDTLNELENWSIGDNGSFQRYGGVQMFVGARFSVVNIATVGLTIQNLFSINLKKISENKIQLTIAEENLKKRRIQSGAAVANIKLHWFDGKRLAQHFVLDLTDDSHHYLYKLAIQGKLDELQTKLPQEAQKMEWKGSERTGYFGIPGVAGKHIHRSEYEMDYEGEGVDTLDIKSRRSSGWLIPLRNHNKLVYQTDSAIILFWYSEMNKANEEVLSQRFLTPGKIMGARGFGAALPPGTLIGSALSQMGVSFSREELEAITPEMLEEILVNFRARCEEMKLSCAQKKNFNKISKSLRSYMSRKWDEVKDKLGFLMIDEPALINSYIKTIGSKKKLYFKFLNEKFQSMEGAAEIVVR
jgi:hypothetical protein